MNKLKTTRKSVVNGSYNLKYAGYCDLATLLKYHEPIAYTAGVYGWNFDVYEVHGVTICTGYRNMPGTCLNKISEYEQMARKIDENYSVSWEERKASIEDLLVEFCALNGGNGSQF